MASPSRNVKGKGKETEVEGEEVVSFKLGPSRLLEYQATPAMEKDTAREEREEEFEDSGLREDPPTPAVEKEATEKEVERVVPVVFEAGTKRTLLDSPASELTPVKRSRTKKATGRPQKVTEPPPVDLGGMEFDEDIDIDEELVPAVKNAVSSFGFRVWRGGLMKL